MRWRLNSSYGLLYLENYSIYLETASSVTDLETRFSYDVAGAIGTSSFVANFERLKVKAITPSSSGVNEPPVVSFPDGDYWITGSDVPGVDGFYSSVGGSSYYYTNGAYDLYQYYGQMGEDYSVQWVIVSSGTVITALSDALYIQVVYYYDTPTPDGWMIPGISPANPLDGTPVDIEVYGIPVTYIPSINGSIAPEGTSLFGVYSYTDAEDHSDDSIYQWYWLSDAGNNVFTPIDTVEGRTRVYEIKGNEGGQIKFGVTARDSEGAVGNTILSDPVLVEIVGGTD